MPRKKTGSKDKSKNTAGQGDLLDPAPLEGEIVSADSSSDSDEIAMPIETLVLEGVPGSEARFYRTASADENAVSTDHDGERVYLAEFMSCALKDIVGSMEYPLYQLQNNKNNLLMEKTFKYKGVTIELSSGKHGLPTMKDKTVLVFIVSQLMQLKNDKALAKDGGVVGRKISFQAKDCSDFTNRSGCGKGNEALWLALERLQGTTMKSNVSFGKNSDIESEIRGQSLLGEYKIRRYKNDPQRRLDSVEVEVSSWIYNAVMTDNVLTLSPRYFDLSPTEQRIYELARKHAGEKQEFAFKFDTLYLKSGCENTKAKFRYQLRTICKTDDMPDYFIRMEKRFDRKTGKSTDFVVFTNRNTLAGKKAPIQIPSLLPSTVEKLQMLFPNEMSSDVIHDLVHVYAKKKHAKKEKIVNIDSEIIFFIIEEGKEETEKLKASYAKSKEAIEKALGRNNRREP